MGLKIMADNNLDFLETWPYVIYHKVDGLLIDSDYNGEWGDEAIEIQDFLPLTESNKNLLQMLLATEDLSSLQKYLGMWISCDRKIINCPFYIVDSFGVSN